MTTAQEVSAAQQVCACGHEPSDHKGGGQCIALTGPSGRFLEDGSLTNQGPAGYCPCEELRLPGQVEGQQIRGIVPAHVLDLYRRMDRPMPTVNVEPTNPGDDTIHVWAHAAGREQHGVQLDVAGAMELVAAIVARIPLLSTVIDVRAVIEAQYQEKYSERTDR